VGPWLFPAFVLVALARAYHGVVTRRTDSGYAARFPTAPDGVAVGAESFTLQAPGGRALLLLHGSGDTPQTLRYLAGELHAAGYTVHAPLLPGHGRSPAAFARVRASDYLDASREGLDVLRRSSSWIGVVGLSMGGALAAQVAAEASDVRALVLLAPYMEPPGQVRWVARTSWLWGAVVPFVPGRGGRSVHDAAAGAESRAYGVFSPRAMRALVATARAGQRALAAVTVPTLVVHSREDIRIPTAIAERATAALRAPTERHWVTGCGHVITVDYCKREVAAMVLSFLSRVAPA
jgi:carboxylesterase